MSCDAARGAAGPRAADRAGHAASNRDGVTRRSILGRLALIGAAAGMSAAAPAGVSRAYAAPDAGGVKLLLVFLRGGYDATNVVIPVSSPFYYEARPTLAVPRPNPSNASAALPLTRPGDAVSWGLHPALGDSIYPLWQQGQVAFVPFAGSEDMTRSHFETQEFVESGLPPGREPGIQHLRGSGFLNRLAGVLGAVAQPVAFTDALPTVMAGETVVPNVSLRGRARPAFDDRQMDLLASLYIDTRFEASIAEGLALRRMVARQSEAVEGGAMGAEMAAAGRNAISARGFDGAARRVAGLMRETFNLAFIDVGGWDTHVNQGGAQGQLANRLGNLGRGLAAFARDMGPAWKSTVVVVLSEFGRAFRENGSGGTDHGHGTVYWVLGGAVRGGRIAGDQVAVGPKTLNQDRDWPVLTEYRAMLRGLFKRLYALDEARLEAVLPRGRTQDLGLV